MLTDDSKSNAGAQKSSAISGDLKELNISLNIENGGVEVLSTSLDKITADYDEEYYDVRIKEQSGAWTVIVTGKVAQMGKTDYVRLYLPGIKRNMDVSVLYGDFSYDLPDNFTDEIRITAADGGVHLSSRNKYNNSSILMAATENDFLKYGTIEYPRYFAKTKSGFSYKHGTQAGKIDIALTGYTSVELDD